MIDREELGHSLRTPLTVVKGSLQHLLKHWDALSERDRKVLVKAIVTQTDAAVEALADIEDRLSAQQPRETITLDEAQEVV